MLTPMRAIRRKCVDDCCLGEINEPKSCTADDCPLFPYRTGKRKVYPKPLYTPIKAMRKKCLKCSENQQEVRNCWDKNCSIYPYRMGKRPKKGEMGANSIG